MDRGSYVAASAGMLQFRQLDVVNNNLANVNTPGFKGQYLVNRSVSFDDTLAARVAADDPYASGDHDRSPTAANASSYTDFTPGPIQESGNPLDAALRHPHDFFVVNTAAGPHYTRAGNFTLDVEGRLVTQDGSEVQGDGGAITVVGGSVSISSGGAVLVDGEQIARVQVVRFEDPSQLQRVGSTRFALAEGGPAPEAVEPDLATRSIEMSNVSAISSMLSLITANRAFQAYTKTASTFEEINKIANDQVGTAQGR